MTSEKKPGLLDRAKKLGERLFTKRNMAIAAPIVAGAAALSSKRVRDAVGDAAKTAGDAIVKAAPARKKPSASAAAKPAAAKPARPAAKKASSAKPAAKAAPTKPAAAKASKPKAAAKPKAAGKPRAKAASKAPAAPTEGSSGNA